MLNKNLCLLNFSCSILQLVHILGIIQEMHQSKKFINHSLYAFWFLKIMELIGIFFNFGLSAFLASFLLPLAFIVKDFNFIRKVSLFFIALGSVCWLSFSVLVLLGKQSFTIPIYRILPELEFSLF